MADADFDVNRYSRCRSLWSGEQAGCSAVERSARLTREGWPGRLAPVNCVPPDHQTLGNDRPGRDILLLDLQHGELATSHSAGKRFLPSILGASPTFRAQLRLPYAHLFWAASIPFFQKASGMATFLRPLFAAFGRGSFAGYLPVDEIPAADVSWSNSLSTLIQTTVATAVWVPYCFLSKRVRATFRY
jgi:hypothetical protein